MAGNDKSAAMKQRVITHMNADHQDSLSIFLEYYCKMPPQLAFNAQLDDITLSHLIIRSKAGRNIVPIEPPMESWAQARERMVEMHHASYKGLGRSEVIISEYRPPTNLKHRFMFVALLASYVAFSSRKNFQEGSLLHRVLLKSFPQVERFCFTVAPVYIIIIGALHVSETVWMAFRLKRHGVPTGSALWWKWLGTCMIDGTFCLERFDGLIKEIEDKKGSHNPSK